MEKEELLDIWKRLLADYGMILVLLALIAFFSIMTISEEGAKGRSAATELLNQVNDNGQAQAVLILSNIGPDDLEMSASLEEKLMNAGHEVLGIVNGDPLSVARKLRELQENGKPIDLIATTKNIAHWGVIQQASAKYSVASEATIIQPSSGKFPRFLKRENLRNIADRISVIAILAIGMTLVIITAGIDLSVGSLIALAAVSVSLFIQNMGGDAAGGGALFMASVMAILLCGLMGFFSGALSTTFKITPFIATLAMMMIARGLAYKFSNVTTIPVNNEAFAILGKGRFAGVPVSVIIMSALYAGAWFLMHWTTFGRRIYAIGGNLEAARLSGVPVNKVLLWVYTICGLLAGLGGVITASNLAGGAATYGDYYELYTIAAVVVGGTSLMGGQGKIMGTLIGAFIIAVIQSGMNQLGIESNTQKIVFGLVIIGAIVSDKYKRKEISTPQLLYLLGGIGLAALAVYFFLQSIYTENFS